MDKLPDEVLIDILDCRSLLINCWNILPSLGLTSFLDLDQKDVISAQGVSRRFFKIARDNTLWRFKCFEKAPSSVGISHQPTPLAALTGTVGRRPSHPFSTTHIQPGVNSDRHGRRLSQRAQAVTDWDYAGKFERIDWYSEYVARNAPLSTYWYDNKNAHETEIKGLAAFADGQKAVGPLEDGSIAIWDISYSDRGSRAFRELGRATSGVLFKDNSPSEPPSCPTKVGFSNVTDCINISSVRGKAYIAVDCLLHEVDIETLQVVSQHKYAWPITALSQECPIEQPLTVGTMWSLNLYDPRVPLRDRSRSPEDLLRVRPSDPEDSIAFFENYPKSNRQGLRLTVPLPTSPSPLTITNSIFGASSSPREPYRESRRNDLSDYAPIEPGPVSILHHGKHEILVAGRFPSILLWDRRYFPRLQHVIHSGARLSCLTSIPHPPSQAGPNSTAEATLVACGEYGGRGSLELYSLPHVSRSPERRADVNSAADRSLDQALIEEPSDSEIDEGIAEAEPPFSSKNRQTASSSKLLSVAIQGTRIVFSDAEGGLKWVERDGRGLARRWNINKFEINPYGASVQGELVARKMISLPAEFSERGQRGDGDLLVWTGEKMGIVTTRLAPQAEGELADPMDDQVNGAGNGKEAEEYERGLRRALERQADERRWMTRFRLR